MSKIIGVRKFYSTIKMPAEEVPAFDTRIGTISNWLSRKIATSSTQTASSADIHAYIYERGLMAVEHDMTEESGQESIAAAYARMMERKRSSDFETVKLARLLDENGVDTFIQWCNENNIDWHETVERYKNPPTEQKKRSKVERFLIFLQTVLADGEPMAVSKIRDIATDTKEIEDEDDWNTMRTVASKNKYTSSYGYWKLPSDS